MLQVEAKDTEITYITASIPTLSSEVLGYV